MVIFLIVLIKIFLSIRFMRYIFWDSIIFCNNNIYNVILKIIVFWIRNYGLWIFIVDKNNKILVFKVVCIFRYIGNI